MKSAVVFLVLAALIASEASIVRAPPQGRSDLIIKGDTHVLDRPLDRKYLRKSAISDEIQFEDAVYIGRAQTRINIIRVKEIGETQNANVWIIAGGINANNVTVRVQSARGRGYNYLFDIWGLY